jgi:hypothetical protein
MTKRNLIPDKVTFNSFMTSLCKHRRSKKVAIYLIYDCQRSQTRYILEYSILFNGYANDGCLLNMINLSNLMKNNDTSMFPPY